MLALFLSAFTTLFVVIDPPGCAPIYAGLTASATPRQAFVMAVRACLIASGILVVFALFGEDLLGALHIELDSFRIAGGIMLFMIALDMVFEKRTERREERAEKVRTAQPQVEDVSVFPMAMPMLAGPGSIGAVMLLSFIALVAARPIIRALGPQVEAVITRLLGVLLAALAAQFVIDGLRAQF